MSQNDLYQTIRIFCSDRVQLGFFQVTNLKKKVILEKRKLDLFYDPSTLYTNNIYPKRMKNGSSVLRIIHMQMITIYFNSSWFECIIYIFFCSGTRARANGFNGGVTQPVNSDSSEYNTNIFLYCHPRNYMQLTFKILFCLFVYFFFFLLYLSSFSSIDEWSHQNQNILWLTNKLTW